jgi:Predicted transcriptional regulators
MPKKQRSPCPLANALDIVGDKWSLLVIRDLILGATTYNELHQAPEGIPTNILADRLKRLQEQGIIKKQVYQQHPPRYSYHLTDKGNGLKPVLLEMLKWGLEYVPGTNLTGDIARKVGIKQKTC